MPENGNNKNNLITYRMDQIEKWQDQIKPIIWDNQRKIELMENIIEEMQNQKREDQLLRKEDRKWKRQVVLYIVGGIIVTIIAQIALNLVK
jgi:ribonucleotide reductase beta subunit family protein with ferritin-like domain